MKVRDVERLFKHWSQFPPVRMLVAAAVGFEPPEPESEKKYLTADDIKRFVQMTGPTIKMPGAT